MRSSALVARARSPGFFAMLVLLVVTLAVFFHGVFVPGHTLFSNDGPLARLSAASHELPERFTGCWFDLNSVGYREPGAMPDISYGLLLLLKPVAFSKFYALIALVVLGLGAWCFFRQSGLAPPACILGGLAAVFNSNFFSDACWGTAGHCIAIGMIFFALAALADTSAPYRWLRVVLAGLAVGMAVTEGADFGAIFSLFVAAFIFYWAWLEAGSPARKLTLGAGRVALVAVCAAVISAQAISELVATDVIGVTTPKIGAQTPVERWDWATQWSLPKRELLSMVTPGIFGYRTDTPDGGCYWGNIGRDPSWLRFDEDGRSDPKPHGLERYTGGGFYAGVSVVLVALWAALQVFRRKHSVFNPTERKVLWFWMVMGVAALLLAFGRYAPFYGLIYRIPYVSMIRNPIKFLDVVSFSVVVLFGFGMDGLWRRYMRTADSNGASSPVTVKGWWNSATGFDRNWVTGCVLVLALSLFAWLVYYFNQDSLLEHLKRMQINETLANSIAAFSIRQVGWFTLFFVLAGGAMFLILSGRFAGTAAGPGAVLLGLLLVADLGRANLPWIICWDYQARYASNPVVDSFRDKPWEHRVAEFPLRPSPQFAPFQQICQLVWAQQLFPYYNIQSLDFVQMPRIPADLANYVAAFKPDSVADVPRVARLWQLTNTRYLLAPTVVQDFLTQQLGTSAPRLKIATRFSLVPKPGGVMTPGMDQMTALPYTNGDYAVFEFQDALPRTRLYSTWQINTNNPDTLRLIADPSFNPAHSVVVAGGVPAPPCDSATNRDQGSVDITSYAPKDIMLKSDARGPTVLLLNDRFDPHWKVAVDGRPEPTLRCNYLMRGVYLDPGAHSIEFKYQPPYHALYLSLAALGLGVVLLGIVMIAGRRAPVPVAVPAPVPAPHPPAARPTAAMPASSKPRKARRRQVPALGHPVQTIAAASNYPRKLKARKQTGV